MIRPLTALTTALVVVVGAWGLPSAPAQTGDTVTVTTEPPGENCEFGGAKITVTHAEPTPDPTEEPTPDPTEEPTPDPTETATPEPTAGIAQDDEPDITYVCNGQQGDPGQDGADGADGADGTDGLDGMDADPDTPGIQARRSNRCATARTIKVKVPKRFHNGAKVRVTTNGQRRRARVRRHRVPANLRTVPCGYYPVLVQRHGVRPHLIVLRLTAHRVAKVSLKG